MFSSSDQTHYDQIFEVLEPHSTSTESAFLQCRFKLIKFFSWRHCEDPANLADETIVRLLKNVDQGQLVLFDKPYSYVYAIAVNVFREYQRAIKKRPSLVAQVAPPSTPEQTDDCRELCLKQLSAPKLQLLSRYYLTDRENLTGQLQLSPNALRLKIYRIKQELRECCEDCRKRFAG